MTHRHKTITEGDERGADGMCGFDGCTAAFSVSTQYCSCGSTRKICHGIGSSRHPWISVSDPETEILDSDDLTDEEIEALAD